MEDNVDCASCRLAGPMLRYRQPLRLQQQKDPSPLHLPFADLWRGLGLGRGGNRREQLDAGKGRREQTYGEEGWVLLWQHCRLLMSETSPRGPRTAERAMWIGLELRSCVFACDLLEQRGVGDRLETYLQRRTKWEF